MSWEPPYCLYFCNLEIELLQLRVLCCLPCIAAIKVDGRPNVAVNYGPLEWMRIIVKDFGSMNVMCEWAEMFECGTYDRSKAAFECFHLPFDAGPPPPPASL